MTRFRDEFDLDDSVEAAAQAFGNVDAETLVKDYWVTESLRALVRAHGGAFVFKGGTSLTKAIGCIDRFSEDLDILITDKPDDVSFDALMKSMAAAVEDATGLEAVLVRSTRNVKREVRYRYPTRHEGLFMPEIVVEMGRRGGDLPIHLDREVSPMIAETPGSTLDVDRYGDLRSFDVRVLHPARTLWEKVILVHGDVASGVWKEHADPTRFARHYGDIGALLLLGEVQRTLRDSAVRCAIDADVRSISGRWYVEPEPCPKGGYAYSPAFNPNGEFGRFLKSSFDEAVERLWSPGRRPTLEGMLATVAASRLLLDPTECS
ncbi:MAG: nucleotidyl transferase AbiEii/AbiGii toxin family protein [Acidimicrobiia bacterium]